MMFDPPDFPYKELTESLKDHYNSDDLLFHNDVGTNNSVSNINIHLTEVTEQMISNVENDLSFHFNNSGRYFNVENSSLLDINSNTIEQNTEFCIVQSDNLFNYEPTLLDENTVNQFLLPLQVSSKENKDIESNCTDILSLNSCAICHEIFTNEPDLLDHTISVHACVETDSIEVKENQNYLSPVVDNKKITSIEETNGNNLDFETEWLVCSTCERVLSTALELVPNEQLCCSDVNGKNVTSRKLHTMYVCDSCSGLFADGEALDRHRLTCYIQDQRNNYTDQENGCTLDKVGSQCTEICFSCDTCGKQFPSAEEMKIHMVQNHRPVGIRSERRPYTNSSNNKMWNCGSCNQLFATARELYRHKRGEDRPPGTPLMAYICEECDKVLGSMCALHTHKKMHKISKPGYPCRVCGRRFNQSGHLAIHMRMHTGERPYPCDLCPKAFKVKVERDDHRRTHTGERPFACTACPKTFTAAARLREHARIHTDQRPYRCDICGAAFRRPYARTVHTLIHTGQKPHECDICGTAFRRSGDMWKHKRTLHGIQAANTDVEIKHI